MSENDNEFNEWKDDTRQIALQKEIDRLRLLNKNQSDKIHNLRKFLYFQLFFVVSLFLILFFKGFIDLPDSGSANNEDLNNAITLLKDSLEKAHIKNQVIKEDTLYLLGSPDSFVADDIVFSVQIGAFVGKDLKKFKSNFTSNIRQDSYGGINQISVGLFTKYNVAVEFLTIIQDMGFTDAFIMALKNGRRINLQDVLVTLPPEEKSPVPIRSEKKVIVPKTEENNSNISDTVITKHEPSTVSAADSIALLTY